MNIVKSSPNHFAIRLLVLISAFMPIFASADDLKDIIDHRTGEPVSQATADGTVYEFKAKGGEVGFWKTPAALDGIWIESPDKSSLIWISSLDGVNATATDPCPTGKGGGGKPCPPPLDCDKEKKYTVEHNLQAGVITAPANKTIVCRDTKLTSTEGMDSDAYTYFCKNPGGGTPPAPGAPEVDTVTITWSDGLTGEAKGSFDPAKGPNVTYILGKAPPTTITITATYDDAGAKFNDAPKTDTVALIVPQIELRQVNHPDEANKQIKKDEIAYINQVPEMPKLEAKVVPDVGSTVKVKWKLEVKYERPSGRVLKEDTVKIPLDGSFSILSADQVWKIYESYPEAFFGGDSFLTYKIGDCEEKTLTFKIRGKNPDDAACKAYIDEHAGNDLWFAYAIAKHETKGEGGGKYYNHFRENAEGKPNWNDDGEGMPGGYGIFQVTGNAQNSDADIPREQIWNWQKNVDAGLVILRSKQTIAVDWMNTQRKQAVTNRSNKGVAIPVPNHSTPRNANDPGTMEGGDEVYGVPPGATVTFRDGTPKIEDAVTMKVYNGAKLLVPGGRTSTGHYCVWANAGKRWEFRRWRVIKGKVNEVSYVDLVTLEIEP